MIINIDKLNKKFDKHKNMIFYISILKNILNLIDTSKIKYIAEIGYEDSDFLPVIYEFIKFKKAYGVEVDKKFLQRKPTLKNIDFIHYKKFLKYKAFFNLIYSQETIYNINNLDQHFKQVFNTLNNNGYYIFTIGNHIQHNLWAYRRDVVKKDNIYKYINDYSIDEITKIASNYFDVYVKLLDIDYFMMYNKDYTRKYSNSLFNLTKETYENKFLFILKKRTINV